MRATILTLGALALALSLGCDKIEEAAPTDSGPIVRDVGFADTQTPTDTPVATDAQTPTDTPVITDVQVADVPTTDGGISDVQATDVPVTDGATDVPATDGATDAGPADAGSCVGDGGCFACPPTTSTQFLNRCTTASCARFDSARLTRLNADGGLPPLP